GGAGALRGRPAARAVSEAGSVRRRKETFRDLDIIASATNPAELTEEFASVKWVVDVAGEGDTKATVVSREGLRFDLRVVPPESFGNLLQHFTGSKNHNVAMREDAVRRGLSISEYGVANVETGDVFKSAEEDAVYEFLGYQPIPPELRENSGELEAADGAPALLDWVVASVHQAPDSRPTERVLGAMQNPYVDAIGHLTGRRIGKRPPRDVDVARVMEGALETGTFLEINGQPDR